MPTTDYPDGLVLRPAEPVAVRLLFTDDERLGRRIVAVDGPTLIRFPDAVTGEVRVSPVRIGSVEVCTPHLAGE